MTRRRLSPGAARRRTSHSPAETISGIMEAVNPKRGEDRRPAFIHRLRGAIATKLPAGTLSTTRMASLTLQTAHEELIATVDLRELRQLRWPFIRLFFPRFVEELELGRYVKELLATRRWVAIRVMPHRDGTRPSDHVFDVYGSRADAPAEGGVHLEPGPG